MDRRSAIVMAPATALGLVIPAIVFACQALTEKNWQFGTLTASISMLLGVVCYLVGRLALGHNARLELAASIMMASLPIGGVLWGGGIDLSLVGILALIPALAGGFWGVFIRMDDPDFE